MQDKEFPGRGEHQVLGDVEYHTAVNDALDALERDKIVDKVWSRDPSVWKRDPEHQKIISNALGWLSVADTVLEHIDELTSFAEEVRREGFKHVLLLGMGGSSLCPEVLRRSFGRIEGYPELLVLDSTVPASVLSFERRIDPARTMFIVSSKSGKTTEPQVFLDYFFDRVARTSGSAEPGRNFIAITDPGTLLEKIAQGKGFRRVFSNPADIGGRYSALSYFGMVPAALAGYDVKEILTRAVAAMQSCKAAAKENTGAQLGAALGALARSGRNKLTLVTPEPIDSLGLWIEQLIAESTGKEGFGILPVAGERLGGPQVYGDDRVFVYLGKPGFASTESGARLRALAYAHHPVVVREVAAPLDLGREFFIWEFATAIAGAILEINPFDQPNVQESKDNTERLLAEFEREGRFSEQELLASSDGLGLYAGGKTQSLIGPNSTPLSIIATHLESVMLGDYVALTAYIEGTPEHDHLLDDIRTHIRDSTRVATTVGYGPRFLHSTGQLHKGGPATGVFIQITSDDREEVPIPGRPYGFSTLKQAQALGDFESLANRSRRVIRVHLSKGVAEGLKTLLDLVRKAKPITASATE
jgi:glucose-6-phosphate isomerase